MSKSLILIKYGGNAMTNNHLKKNVLTSIGKLRSAGNDVVIVHGGGPFIKEVLTEAKVESEFIDGQRQTTPEAFEYVQMALKGKVNSHLVSLLNAQGQRAVGLSGQDGQIVTAKKREHMTMVNGKPQAVDLGRVGDVQKVNPQLIHLLLQNDFIPVIACIAANEQGEGFNINGDMFAGHVAGALKADRYIVLTDVDGLLRDKDDPSTIINELSIKELSGLVETGVIQGGMIPKMESCQIAIQGGARTAGIVNGTKPEQLLQLTGNEKVGTKIIP
ncbi:MAG: acetylglutamate kinase [Salinivirgaceae bacterium]|jgi:acetylglutamate kinase|nr:acetylglutamate kinase [Salinivirgaceae bacterium]